MSIVNSSLIYARRERPIGPRLGEKLPRLSNLLIVEIVAGTIMKRFIEGEVRTQVTLLPECLDDFIAEDNTVRIVDVFINELDLVGLGFDGATPAATGRPSYHPSVLLKLYLYGYLNRIQSSRRLERECQRNVELMPRRPPKVLHLWPPKLLHPGHGDLTH